MSDKQSRSLRDNLLILLGPGLLLVFQRETESVRDKGSLGIKSTKSAADCGTATTANRSLDNNSAVGKRWAAAESWRSRSKAADNDSNEKGPSDNRPTTTPDTSSLSTLRRRIAASIAYRCLPSWSLHQDVTIRAIISGIVCCASVAKNLRERKRERGTTI